jgi:lipid-A-disaccharide synthase-like uncharacterized protein
MTDQMIEAMRILSFAALTLSVRVLTWLSLLGVTGLFIYAVLYPTIDRTIAAALFALLVYLPSLWTEKKERRAQPVRQYQQQESEAA